MAIELLHVFRENRLVLSAVIFASCPAPRKKKYAARPDADDSSDFRAVWTGPRRSQTARRLPSSVSGDRSSDAREKKKTPSTSQGTYNGKV